jgi:hypothetical protein
MSDAASSDAARSDSVRSDAATSNPAGRDLGTSDPCRRSNPTTSDPATSAPRRGAPPRARTLATLLSAERALPVEKHIESGFDHLRQAHTPRRVARENRARFLQLSHAVRPGCELDLETRLRGLRLRRVLSQTRTVFATGTTPHLG